MTRLASKVRQNPMLMSLYVPTLMTSFSQGMLVPVLPVYVSSFQAPYWLVGLVLAGVGIGQLIGDVPAGMLIRRLNVKSVMLIGLAGLSLAMTTLFVAQSIWQVFIALVVSGACGALYNVSRHAYLTDHITLISRGRSIATYGGIHRIGRFAGPAFGGFLGATFGLRAPFLAYGIICGAALLFVAFFVERVEHDEAAVHVSSRSQLWLVLKSQYRILMAAGIGQLFAQMIRNGRDVLLPLYAADVIGLKVDDIGLIISITAAIEMSLFYPAGLIMDRFGRKYAVVPTFLLQAAGMLLLPLTGGFLTLLLASSLMGFANGLSSGTMMTIGSDLAPSHARGEFLGVWRLIGDAGFTGAPLMIGAIADMLTLGAASVVIGAAGISAAAVFAFLVPETLEKKQPLPEMGVR